MLDSSTDSGLPTRRTLIAGVGAASAAVALAACGTQSAGTGTPSSAPSAAGGAPSDPASAAPSAASNALGKSSDIPVGGGKIFADQKVVVTQPTAGAFKAFTAVCTHQGCTVASVSNGIIQCPCHGSQYSITDGSVKKGPAPAPLAAEKVTVQGGNLILG